LPFCHVTLKASKPKPTAYPKLLKTLGDHLRKKRLDSGLHQRQVARQIGVCEATIYNWENNRVLPTSRLLAQIVQFLGYRPAETVRGEQKN
jgi:transcriptional regulator with XRE-family HTH domain